MADEDDELSTSSTYASLFEKLEAIFRDSTVVQYLLSPTDQKEEGYVMWIGSGKNNSIGSCECSRMFCSIGIYQIE